MRSLQVYMGARSVGALREDNSLWAFEYDPAWVQAADSFDLSPALPRSALRHTDGASQRPVQWYFDNLLPEELLREALAREAGIRSHEDAFALLEYLGAESAGSLTLLPPGTRPPTQAGRRPLPFDALSQRIRNLPRATLAAGAPKRMSIAGAQHKLLVLFEDGQLFEPEGATPSTHILKPNHQHPEIYPASVFNEYITMRLARALRLDVPKVWMLFVPEPVYLIERFDRRRIDGAGVERLHIVDACQLLNKDRLFKHTGATLQALRDIIEACSNKIAARRNLFSWLVFNILVANDDCHLKNLSFRVGPDGIYLAPHYDLLSTGAHYTRAVAGDSATWPRMPLAIKLPGADFLDQITRATVLEAGGFLGVPVNLASRIVSEMAGRLIPAAKELAGELSARSAETPAAAAGSQDYLARILLNMVYPETARRLQA